MNYQLWLPVLALMLGGVLHSLSDDGGASILSHFGISARLPTAAIPVAVLLIGGASGTIDSVVAGSDWQHALATAAAAAIATVFGATTQHGLTNKTLPKLGALLLVGGLAMSTSACAWLKSDTGKAVVDDLVLAADDIACIEAQSEMGASEPAIIAEACHLPPTVITQIVNTIVGHEKGKALARELRAQHDAAIAEANKRGYRGELACDGGAP